MKKIIAFLITLLFIPASFSILSLGAESTSDSRIKEIQQYLNREIPDYIDYIPLDGVSSPYHR